MKWIVYYSIAMVFTSAALAGTVTSQELRQPRSLRNATFTESYYYQPESPAPPPEPEAADAESPSLSDVADAPDDVEAPEYGGTKYDKAYDSYGKGKGHGKGGCDCSCYKFGPDEPFEICSRTCRGWKIGGWAQGGYTTYDDGQFNNRPDQFVLNQGWVYIDKEADGSCGFDWGFRVDYVYGTDGPDTQAFGNRPDTYDFGWNNGGFYGHAIPQLYGEIAYGDLSVKIGHFFTIIGYEVVQAPDNFFYSHSFTQYNAEPFTHTGVLASYDVNCNLTVHGGWVAGWDTGFDRFEGSTFLGGVNFNLTENIKFAYALNAGDRGFGVPNDEGYGHSVVLDWSLTDRLTYVFQSDWNTWTTFKTIGINNYLFYRLNDCWAVGVRAEWLQNRATVFDTNDLYEITAGLNYKPHANVVIRPEVRWDQDDDGFVVPAADNNLVGFGIDAIITF